MLDSYGFEYAHDGGRYSFSVLATSRAEAEARVRAMAEAGCEGTLNQESSVFDAHPSEARPQSN